MESENKIVGRPKLCPDQEDPLKLYASRLSHRQMRIAKKLGGGNFSEGLRTALEHCAADIRFMDAEVAKRKK